MSDGTEKTPGSKLMAAGAALYLTGSLLMTLVALFVVGLLVWAFLL